LGSRAMARVATEPVVIRFERARLPIADASTLVPVSGSRRRLASSRRSSLPRSVLRRTQRPYNRAGSSSRWLAEIRERPRFVMESCPGLRAPTSDWWANAPARAHRRVPLSRRFCVRLQGRGLVP
jgi:hypothetical protein